MVLNTEYALTIAQRVLEQKCSGSTFRGSNLIGNSDIALAGTQKSGWWELNLETFLACLLCYCPMSTSVCGSLGQLIGSQDKVDTIMEEKPKVEKGKKSMSNQYGNFSVLPVLMSAENC